LLWVQVVSGSDALNQAQPLKSTEPVNKGKVWLLLCGGAAGLFVATLLIENNTAWFPAIARANVQMTSSREQEESDQETDAGADISQAIDVDARAEAAVLQGLKAARDRVQQEQELRKP
jgi:hypothetical protein